MVNLTGRTVFLPNCEVNRLEQPTVFEVCRGNLIEPLFDMSGLADVKHSHIRLDRAPDAHPKGV